MSEKIKVQLGNVQKTLLLPLWGRAKETKKRDPLLVDKTAVEVMEKLDFDFSTISKGISPISQYAWIMRSRTTDRVINEFLRKHPTGTIVNIGCGLDTTFDRVDNGSLRWYDLDLPDVINLRRQFIPETKRRTYIISSFLEPEWLNEISVTDSVLFVSAGVFYYFQEPEIKTFLTHLADKFPGSEILFDAASAFGVKTANQMVIKSSGLDEKSFLVWGLERSEDVEKWDSRFKVLETLYFFRDNRKLLPLNVWLVGVFSDSRRIQYMVHLQM
ncbi:class I SAM-dependent methyltransferase [Leptolinea tardivitalis]|uniref:class I SAM-dependent methyltransferase n=1 Tax=Leptolinea tardivitalis TaxID=229920 RepID=UPI0007842B2B|nr:class I SAM-dependent methyltransferase [Leptolinea tardivitalis]GAP22608.1 O-Methyltransferase [Leptolinea tardivitalis]